MQTPEIIRDVYIGLGSNLDNPKAHVQHAISELDAIDAFTLTGISQLYRSAPVGPEGQDDYINAAVKVTTSLAAEAVLDILQSIEQAHQRKRIVRWGPRTLDLDILLFGQEEIHTSRLDIPHKELQNRNFVVYPLLDITPELRLPNGIPLEHYATQLGHAGLFAIPKPEDSLSAE